MARRVGMQQGTMATAVSEARDLIESADAASTDRTVDQTTYLKALDEARQQFKVSTERQTVLQSQLVETEHEIGRLRRTITALSAICSEHSTFHDLQITVAVRQVMTEELGLVTTKDVVQRLEEIGFDVRSQKNPQASVHTILQRLATKDLIERVDYGKTIMWKGPKYKDL
jgi:hypothetical protein